MQTAEYKPPKHDSSLKLPTVEYERKHCCHCSFSFVPSADDPPRLYSNLECPKCGGDMNRA